MPHIPTFRRGFATLAAVYGLIQTARAQSSSFPPGVIATGTNGPTNPPEPTMGTAINQTSDARLLSVNSVDDFCLFAPPGPHPENIGNSETYEVAWCTQPRNNARVIPDGTFTGVTFLKTDFYVQVMGYGNLTRLNIPAGDYGGELDPHGQYGDGNPIGGNVTSNTTGSDQHFAEWMVNLSLCLGYLPLKDISFSPVAIYLPPTCAGTNSTKWAANLLCLETTIERHITCDADVAYPPGWYPTATVSGTPVFSTFAQRFRSRSPTRSRSPSEEPQDALTSHTNRNPSIPARQLPSLSLRSLPILIMPELMAMPDPMTPLIAPHHADPRLITSVKRSPKTPRQVIPTRLYHVPLRNSSLSFPHPSKGNSQHRSRAAYSLPATIFLSTETSLCAGPSYQE
ncbi:hypothetical protein NMY22_g18946 [Coprinellus aureogranulatus]|nr:hypothetical protein NMY22_g18946 [Coprinellus aureogranulatus]